MSKAFPKNLPLLQKTNAGNMRNVKNTNVKFTSTGKAGVNQQKTELVCHNPSTLLKILKHASWRLLELPRANEECV
eukprot:gene2293-5492_t